jgi:hypothetical protein
MIDVFTNDYLIFEVEAARAEAQNAALKLTLLEVLYAAGHALHANFVSGDEAKWKHEAQREALIGLSDACKAAMAKLSAKGAPEMEKAS